MMSQSSAAGQRGAAGFVCRPRPPCARPARPPPSSFSSAASAASPHLPAQTQCIVHFSASVTTVDIRPADRESARASVNQPAFVCSPKLSAHMMHHHDAHDVPSWHMVRYGCTQYYIQYIKQAACDDHAFLLCTSIPFTTVE